MIRSILALLLALCAMPVLAADRAYPVDEAIWVDKGNALPHPKSVNIAVPRSIGALALTRLHGFSPGGFDLGAQYRNAEGNIFATVFIYRPELADAGNTMIMTDAVIRANYGPKVRALENGLVAVNGRPNAAHRRAYDGILITQAGAQGDGGPQASVLMAMQAGDWIVKIRTTGSSSKREEVVRLADALLAGLTFDAKVPVIPAALDNVTECPETVVGPAAARKIVKDTTSLAMMVLYGAVAHSLKTPPKARNLCVMQRSTGTGVALILRRADGPQQPELMLFGDTGGAVTIVDPPVSASGGPGVIVHVFDQAEMFGPFDRRPSATQLLGLLDGNETWIGAPISTLKRDAKGNFNVSIVTPAAR